MGAGLRRRLRALHGYLGLSLGLVLVLLGLTGSALVFYLDLDQALNPALRPAPRLRAESGAGPDLDRALARLRAAYPPEAGYAGRWRLELPMDASRPLMARYYRPPERAGRHFAPLLVSLDPVSLEITSARFWGDGGMTWLYDLHYTLLLEEDGLALVGWCGLGLGLLLLSGLWLWWPRPGRWREALRLRPRPRPGLLAFDLHMLAGWSSALVLLVVALSGVGLAWPQPLRGAIAPFSPLAERPQLGGGWLAPGQTGISLHEARQRAEARFPGAELRWVESSSGAGEPLMLRLYQPGEPSRRFPHTQLWLDPASGALLAERDPRQLGAGDTLLDWLHPLHNGEALGLAGRWLVLLSGLAPLVLGLSGGLRWWQRRQARARSRAGRPSQ
jgi:uncharacterized iron-regulated membrane protein